jgi:2-(1,2-epoxy-1,2-dihydrophenyl)acetyl-CoA isomerase
VGLLDDYETLKTALVDKVLTVTLHRPEAANAITPQMADELAALMDAVHATDQVRVVVLTGAGKAFCAGGDILEDAVPVSGMTPWEYRRNVEQLSQPIIKIAELDRPVIAAINGAAVGGGWDLALACDIRVASNQAKFRDAYVQLGVMPELGGTYFLPRLAGTGRAKLISFTGDVVTAEQARHYGLVEVVVAADELEETVAALAKKIASGPSRAIAMTKLAMNQAMHMNLRQALEHAKATTPALLASPDYREAVSAFLEKRKPRFEGT